MDTVRQSVRAVSAEDDLMGSVSWSLKSMKYPLIYTASRSNEYNTNLYKKVRSELHFGTEGAEEKSAKEFNFY